MIEWSSPAVGGDADAFRRTFPLVGWDGVPVKQRSALVAHVQQYIDEAGKGTAERGVTNLSTSVLVLNQNYEPLNVCNEKRAIVLVSRGKAEVLEHGLGEICSPSQRFLRPSVIRLIYLIRRPRPKARLTRREVFQRDRYTCQYCGVKSKDLTIDHVIPRHRGGKHTWDNLVSACRACNHRKGGKTLDEARMTLLRRPEQPRVSTYYILHPYLQTYHEWKKFVPEWEIDDEA